MVSNEARLHHHNGCGGEATERCSEERDGHDVANTKKHDTSDDCCRRRPKDPQPSEPGDNSTAKGSREDHAEPEGGAMKCRDGAVQVEL